MLLGSSDVDETRTRKIRSQNKYFPFKLPL